MLEWGSVFLSSFVLSAGSIFLLRRMAVRVRVLVQDHVALVGGIGIGFSVLSVLAVGVFFGGAQTGMLGGILIPAFLMLLGSVFDDVRELSVGEKILLQVFCTGLLVFGGVSFDVPGWSLAGEGALTLFWVIGITNAFNLLDVMDGVSAGIALVVGSALMIGFGAWLSPGSIVVTTALLGAICGFLLFNFPPATVYLGNAGSHFLGFLLGAISVGNSNHWGEHALAFLVPIVVFGIPLLETGCLIYFRCRKGILPFHKSRDHMALRLERMGFSKQMVLIVMLAAAAFFSWLAVMMSRADMMSAIMFFSAAVVLGGMLCGVLKKADAHG